HTPLAARQSPTPRPAVAYPPTTSDNASASCVAPAGVASKQRSCWTLADGHGVSTAWKAARRSIRTGPYGEAIRLSLACALVSARRARSAPTRRGRPRGLPALVRRWSAGGRTWGIGGDLSRG